VHLGVAVALAACATNPQPVILPPVQPPAPTPVPVEAPSLPAEGTVPAGAAGSLYYHLVGRGRDTVLVPLGAYLEKPLGDLSRSHVLVFYDPRHRGRSTAYADTTLSTFNGDVQDVERVRLAVGASKVSLIGFSYYAAVVAEYAASFPDRVTRVALLSPLEPNDSLAAQRDPSAAMARLDTIAARALVRMRAAGKDTTDTQAYCLAYWKVNAPVYSGDPANASRLDTSFCALPNEGVRAFAAHVGRVLASVGARYDFTPAARRVLAPTLVFHGDRDLVATADGARAWAAALPDARLLTLRGGGHMLYLDDADAVARSLATFLGGAWPAGAEVVR
jgi:pimeloyl-ACP methyl ester carboxylesterase